MYLFVFSTERNMPLRQFLFHFQAAGKDILDPLFGLNYITFQYLSQYPVVKFHRVIFHPIEYVIDFVEAGFGVPAFLYGVGDLRELLFKVDFLIHQLGCSALIEQLGVFSGYGAHHGSEFSVDLRDPHLDVEAPVLGFFSYQSHSDVHFQRFQCIGVLPCGF